MMTKKPGEAPQPAEQASEPASDDLLMVAEDVLTAVAEGDPRRLAEALKAAFMICESYEYSEGEE